MAFLTYNEEPRDADVPNIVHWYYGPSGAGKTMAIKAAVMDQDAYWKSPNDQWWDGYDSHETVVLDDFRGSWMKFTNLLRLLDSTPLRIQNKGGFRQMKARTFYISSIRHPQFIYNLEDEPVRQLLRRITQIHHIQEAVPEVGVPEVEGNSRPPLLQRQNGLFDVSWAYEQPVANWPVMSEEYRPIDE